MNAFLFVVFLAARAFAGGSSGWSGGDALLASTQTWTGNNTFNGGLVTVGNQGLTVNGTATATAFSGPLSGSATSLAANGANCSAGSFPLGVDTSGAVESCTAASLADPVYTSSASAVGFTFNTVATLVRITDTSAARAVTIATAQNTAGRIIILKDEGGSAGTNNITITPQSGNIDGQANVKIVVNYGVARLYTNGTDWFTW